ncbi:MAG: anti-sigma factor antagonist [Lachnospiraceae bacterium]|nr:anti-sigma factor antagonist [Lachnospiraceae bacterium]
MNQNTFSYEARGQVLVIHLPKELDHHNCRNLRYETDLLLSENYVSRIIFDFSRTEFMDSSGIGVLLNRYKQMAGSGGSVAIYGVGSQVHRILNVGGLSRLVPCFESKEAALTD